MGEKKGDEGNEEAYGGGFIQQVGAKARVEQLGQGQQLRAAEEGDDAELAE